MLHFRVATIFSVKMAASQKNGDGGLERVGAMRLLRGMEKKSVELEAKRWTDFVRHRLYFIGASQVGILKV